MDRFKNKIKTKLTLLSIGTLLYIFALFFTNAYVKVNENISTIEFTRGFRFGIGFAILCYLIFIGIKYALALSNADKLKNLYIAETDERKLLVYQMAGSVGMDLTIIGFAVSAVFSSYFNSTVFFTLLTACLFVGLIRTGLKLYYKNKY